MAFGRLGAAGTGFGRLGSGGSGGGVAAAVGGAVLLTGETDGLGVDFIYATDAQRVASKTASVTTEYALDAYVTTSGTITPKLVYDVSGNLVWTPHNLLLNSAVPASQSVTTIVGAAYTVTVVGSGTMTGSAGASGVATQASPLTYTATTTTSTFTLAGSLTRIQMNLGTVATAYLATTAARRVGCSIDYHPTTHAARGLLVEQAATNLLLNSLALSTQSATVTAVAHTLSFWGTGTVTLSGVSTAGPLVGTGAANRVSLTFTPTAGSLTLTVTGTVTRAQLEAQSAATSYIPTFGVTQARAADNFIVPITPAVAAEYSMYGRMTSPASANFRIIIASDGTGGEYAAFSSSVPTMTWTIRDGNVQQAGITNGTVTANTPIAAAGRVKVNDFAVSVGGAAATFDTAGTVPTVTQIQFGNNGTGVTLATEYIEKLAIVPRAWSDAELQTKSAS